MPILKKILCYLIVGIFSSSLVAAELKQVSTPLLDSCDSKNMQATAYSICLDEAVKQVEREHEAWILQTENKLTENAKGPQIDAALYELRKANKYYQQYIESYCRSLFFANQGSPEAANIFRQCKIKQLRQRIELLKH